jgi:hypothetical protein
MPTEATLVEQVLCDEYDADVPVMTALGKEIAHVL